MTRSLLDCIVAGYCPACDQECGLAGGGPESVMLDCGHTIGFPRRAPVALRGRADGTVVLYTDLADMRRVQQREGNGWTV